MFGHKNLKAVALGMTLIEISIGLMIASMMSVMLFRFLRQTTKVSQTVEATLDYTDIIPLAYDQLERDITAIYVPDALYEKKPAGKKGAAAGTVTTGKSAAAGSAAGKTAEAPAKPPEEDQEPRPTAFYCELKDKRFLTLSFITTNRLVSFKQQDPYRMQILYRTVPDEQHEGLLKLVRQQSSDIRLPLKKFEEGAVPAFTLMRGIKSCSLHLFSPQIKKSQKALKSASEATEQQMAQQATEETKERQEEKKLEKLDAWIPDEMKKKLGVYIPAYIEIEGIFEDATRLQEKPFKFVYKIHSFEEHADRMKQRQIAKKDVQKRKDVAKTGAGKGKLTTGKTFGNG